MIKEEQLLIEEWLWKMEYYKRKGLPPAEKWAWDEAGKAYQEKGGEKCASVKK